MSTYTLKIVEEFSEKAINEACCHLLLEPINETECAKFLENIETMITYLLESGEEFYELATSVHIRVRYFKVLNIGNNTTLHVKYNDYTKKIEVILTVDDLYKPAVEGHLCGISCNTDREQNYFYDLSKKSLKVPLEKLPLLLNTDLKHFAKAKLQGLI